MRVRRLFRKRVCEAIRGFRRARIPGASSEEADSQLIGHDVAFPRDDIAFFEQLRVRVGPIIVVMRARCVLAIGGLPTARRRLVNDVNFVLD